MEILKKSTQAPFSDLNHKLSSLIKYLDKNLLAFQNNQQQFYQLQQKHQSFLNIRFDMKNLQYNHLKLLSSFLIENKVTKLCHQIQILINQSVNNGIAKIRTLITDIIYNSSQLYSLFQLPQIGSFQPNLFFNQSKDPQLIKLIKTEGNLPRTKISQILKQSFQLDLHKTGFTRLNFEQSSKNMEFVQYNQVKSKDANSLKTEEKNILDQIVLVRQKIINQSKVQIEQTQTNKSAETYSELFNLYQKLSTHNQFKSVCHKIIYPIYICQQQIKKTDNQMRQLTQELQMNYQNIHQSNSVQFKIQAQGFGSNKTLQLPSIRQKLHEHFLRNLPSKDKDSHNVQFLTFQQHLIQINQLLDKNQYQKYFQFGFIDTTFSTNFIRQNSFLSFVSSQNLPVLDKNVNNILNNQPQSNKFLEQSKFSIKILNIDNKFFIQSQKQAKLIKLSADWQYFSLQVDYSSQNLKLSEVKLYGLVKKYKQQKQTIQNCSGLYQKQMILTCSLSPSLCKKVLKPFFYFKNFQCKIHIKNI